MDITSDGPRPSVNEKFVQTEKGSGEDHWYVLDNAACFMPAVSDKTVTLVFRVSAGLTERVKLPELERALANIAPRFPYYLVELRKGFFWYYLEPFKDKLPEPVADSKYPCVNMHVRRRGRFLFRVRAYRSRIAVEFCHVLTDGTGALTFLKALLLEYYRLLGVETPDPKGIFLSGEEPSPEESEDAFNLYCKDKVPFAGIDRKAFHFPAHGLLPGQYRVTTGIIPLPAIIAKAKENGATLTEFLVAVYFASLQDIFHGLPAPVRRGMHPLLAVQVPVNLRKLFPSKTMRNFSLFVLPSLDTRLGLYEFPEIVKRVHHYMQAAVHEKDISMQISRNVAGGRKIFIRALPLFMKGIAAKLVYKRMGDDTISGFISNLGAVELPEPLAGRVERFEFIPAPSRRCKTNANVVSYKDRLFVCFGSLAASTDMERLFFSKLTAMGLSVAVESNM
jgi:hypothetical protein